MFATYTKGERVFRVNRILAKRKVLYTANVGLGSHLAMCSMRGVQSAVGGMCRLCARPAAASQHSRTMTDSGRWSELWKTSAALWRAPAATALPSGAPLAPPMSASSAWLPGSPACSPPGTSLPPPFSPGVRAPPTHKLSCYLCAAFACLVHCLPVDDLNCSCESLNSRR